MMHQGGIIYVQFKIAVKVTEEVECEYTSQGEYNLLEKFHNCFKKCTVPSYHNNLQTINLKNSLLNIV